jgi:hypothetical protein
MSIAVSSLLQISNFYHLTIIFIMKTYTIFAAGLGSVIALALAMTVSAQISATAGVNAGVNVNTAVNGNPIPSGVDSATIRARIEARYGTSTAAGIRAMGSTTSAENQQQKVVAIQGRSDTEITNRIDSLTKLLSRIESLAKISSSDKASLSSSLQVEIADLTSLKASIDSDTSTSTLKTDFQSITKFYRVYMLVLPQTSIIVAADRVLDLVNDFNTLSTKLQDYVTTAQSNGTDVSSTVSAMADITAKVTDASTQANAAISEVASLQPDQGATTTLDANTAALKSAQTDIKTATADLTTARKDVTTVVDVIKDSMKISTNTSVSTTQ